MVLGKAPPPVQFSPEIDRSIALPARPIPGIDARAMTRDLEQAADRAFRENAPAAPPGRAQVDPEELKRKMLADLEAAFSTMRVRDPFKPVR
jgi:hypothetical protein